MRGKLGQALNIFSGRAVSAVFSAWQEESSAKKKMNTKLKNAVQKLRNRQGPVSVTPPVQLSVTHPRHVSPTSGCVVSSISPAQLSLTLPRQYGHVTQRNSIPWPGIIDPPTSVCSFY